MSLMNRFVTNPISLRSYYYSINRFIHNDVHVDNAVSSFQRMLQMRHTPPIVEFNKILTSLVKIKHYTTVISLCHKLEQFKEITPDLCTFNILINCYCHLSGQITFSFSVLGKILKMGYQPNTITFTTLIKGLCLSGHVKKALHFHDHVLTKGFQLNQVSYGTLIFEFNFYVSLV
jgi:pentatricopeptide repeat protein